MQFESLQSKIPHLTNTSPHSRLSLINFIQLLTLNSFIFPANLKKKGGKKQIFGLMKCHHTCIIHLNLKPFSCKCLDHVEVHILILIAPQFFSFFHMFHFSLFSVKCTCPKQLCSILMTPSESSVATELSETLTSKTTTLRLSSSVLIAPIRRSVQLQSSLFQGPVGTLRRHPPIVF